MAQLRFAGAPARQVDPTSCGAACLVVLRALGDDEFAALLAADPAEFGRQQRRMRAATARRALGPLPWPRAFGTD